MTGESNGYLGQISSSIDPERHVHTWPDIRLEAEHFSEHGDGLYAEVQIWEQDGGLLRRTRVNLLAEQTLHRLALSLQKRAPELDWDGMLTQAAWRSIEAWRQGTPFQLPDLGVATERTWLLRPFIEDDGLTQLFAPGGSGKGYFAVAASISVATGLNVFGFAPETVGPVAYLDYEASYLEFSRRIRRLAEGLNLAAPPPIYYRREYAPLASTADAVARFVDEKGIRLVVIDSKGMAIAGAPEKSEPSLDLLKAGRRLGVPILLIDHMSKEGIKEGEGTMAYGSVYIYNEARLVWRLRSDTKEGEIRMLLTNPKSNNGPKSKSVSYNFTFQGTAVGVSAADNHMLMAKDNGQTVADRITELLLDKGALSSKDIARELGATQDTVRKTLSRGEGAKFWRMGGADLWRVPDPELPDPM